MRRTLHSFFLCLFLFTGVHKVLAQAGIYKVTGYSFHYLGNLNIDTFKTLTSTSDGKLQVSSAGDSRSSSQFTFRTGTAKRLTDFQGINMDACCVPANFMYLDNPFGVAYYPGSTTGYVSSVYDNTYDSVPNTFFMHYGWMDGQIRQTPEPFLIQVYEKWELVIAPVIRSFSPASGFAGDTVTIRGSGFTFTKSVAFNGVAATEFTVVSDSIITATVPATSTGDINVANPAGSYDKGLFVYVTQPPSPPPALPVIQSFSPVSGFAGDIVTVKGSGFTGATAVTFNGVAASGFKVVSDTVITATAPQSSTGNISVTTPNGSDSLGTFTYITLASDGSRWDTAGNPRFAKLFGYSLSLSTDTAGRPCVLFSNREAGGLATLMRLEEDGIWRSWGGAASENIPFSGKLVIGTNNQPYIAYTDSFHIGIIVKRYTGTTWETLGNSGNDTLRDYYNQRFGLVLDKTNTPYLMTRNYPNGDIYVFTYNGTGWVRIDAANPGHAIHAARSEAQIAVDTNRNVYVIYSAPGNYAAMVERYNGSRWDTLGTPGFTHSANGIYYPDIKISSSGQPIVAMQDDDGSENASVFQYDGTAWQIYGKQYFSPSHVYNVSLALSPLDQPFVLFTDSRDSSHGTVMTPAGNGDSNWQYVGNRGVAAEPSYTDIRDIAVSKEGIVYLSYASQNAPDFVRSIVVLKNGADQLLIPRTIPGLYKQGDSTCTPWIEEYPQWTTYTGTDSSGTHIEMQTQFQDVPGSLCGYQSFIDSSSTYRTAQFGPAYAMLTPRNYRITFSDSSFAQPVGIRLFGLTSEINTLLAQAGTYGTTRTTDDIVIYRYDGPNEDYMPGNNESYHLASADSGLYASNYTLIKPVIHYFGAGNEYYYLEFYTNHFSEFYSGISLVTVLPVNLVSFSASAHDKIASLVWQTSNEINTSSFTVQRSTDGVHFTSVGNVRADGTGGNHSYSYRDDVSGILAKTIYYRLLITDKDGSSRESKIVSVALADSHFIAVQPNPAHSYALVTCNATGRKTITVTDVNGRKVFVKTTGSNSESIGVGAFAKGLYLVRIDYAGGYDTRKLLVE